MGWSTKHSSPIHHHHHHHHHHPHPHPHPHPIVIPAQLPHVVLLALPLGPDQGGPIAHPVAAAAAVRAVAATAVVGAQTDAHLEVRLGKRWKKDMPSRESDEIGWFMMGMNLKWWWLMMIVDDCWLDQWFSSSFLLLKWYGSIRFIHVQCRDKNGTQILVGNSKGDPNRSDHLHLLC